MKLGTDMYRQKYIPEPIIQACAGCTRGKARYNRKLVGMLMTSYIVASVYAMGTEYIKILQNTVA